MKQHITKEQWDELSEEQKRAFGFDLAQLIQPEMPNIGQMIEFLSRDLKAIQWNNPQRDIEVVLNEGCFMKPYIELCDALWKAVRYKIAKDLKD